MKLIFYKAWHQIGCKGFYNNETEEEIIEWLFTNHDKQNILGYRII